MHFYDAMRIPALFLLVFIGCATELEARRDVAWQAQPTVEGRCAGVPDALREAGFRHAGSEVFAHLGGPRHRGIDLIASTSSERQLIEGEIRYGKLDKALEDEAVDVYACLGHTWQPVGQARTDEEGHFVLALVGAERLPIGLRDVYASVRGDRTGVEFVAYVAPIGSRVAVTDVDGTLTSSENAVVATVLLHTEAGVQPAAPATLSVLAADGYQPIYLTARGRVYTETTRRWLADHGFPRGPMILADGLFTRPGVATLAHKTRSLATIRNAGFVVAIGIGNRATDVTAYERAGVAADHIFIKQSEFRSEVAPRVARGEAIGFDTYARFSLP